MYACITKNGSFECTQMFLASPQLSFEMDPIHLGHPVVCTNLNFYLYIYYLAIQRSKISTYTLSYGIFFINFECLCIYFSTTPLSIGNVPDEILNSMTNYRCNQFTKWQPNLVLLAILKRKSFYNGKSVMPLQTFLFLYM